MKCTARTPTTSSNTLTSAAFEPENREKTFLTPPANRCQPETILPTEHAHYGSGSSITGARGKLPISAIRAVEEIAMRLASYMDSKQSKKAATLIIKRRKSLGCVLMVLIILFLDPTLSYTPLHALLLRCDTDMHKL